MSSFVLELGQTLLSGLSLCMFMQIVAEEQVKISSMRRLLFPGGSVDEKEFDLVPSYEDNN